MAQDIRKGRYASVVGFRSLALGLGVVFLGSVLAAWLNQQNIHGSLAFVDNIVTGIAAGLIVFFYELWHQRGIAKQLEIVALMNHHVRNDLQVIIYAISATLADREKSAGAVQDAVKHIEWVLREVLPGELHLACTAVSPNARSAKPSLSYQKAPGQARLSAGS